MKKRRKSKKQRERAELPECVQRLRQTGAGMASATRGRARTFTDRKKEEDRNACRGKQEDE